MELGIRDTKWMVKATQGILILATILFIFSPDYFFFKKSLEFANYILFVYILVGLIFLILDSHKLVLTTFICAGFLAFFLKTNNDNLRRNGKGTDLNPFVASIVDLQNVEKNRLDFARFIDSLNYDIIVFHHVDSLWQDLLDGFFSARYGHYAVSGQDDDGSMVMYARREIEQVETIYTENIPIIQSVLLVGDYTRLILMCIDLPPPANHDDYSRLERVLRVLAAQIFKDRDFRYRPTNQILYDKKVECREFGEIAYGNTVVGVKGTYQVMR